MINECLMEMKGFLKGWRLATLVSSIMIAVIMGLLGDNDITILLVCFIQLTFITARLKLSKLHYLMPGEKKDRLNNILIKCLGVFLFDILWYLIIAAVLAALSDDSFPGELQKLFCEVIPVIISYMWVALFSGYNIRNFWKKAWVKKNKAKYMLAISALVVPFSFLYFISDRLHGIWYMIMTTASYLCAIYTFGCAIAVFRHSNTSYENIRKEEKLFS